MPSVARLPFMAKTLADHSGTEAGFIMKGRVWHALWPVVWTGAILALLNYYNGRITASDVVSAVTLGVIIGYIVPMVHLLVTSVILIRWKAEDAHEELEKWRTRKVSTLK